MMAATFFVADFDRGVEVFETDSNGKYQPIAGVANFGRADRVVLSPDEQVLYLIDHSNVNGLRSLDVSNPENPVLLGSTFTSSNPVYHNLAVSHDGTTLYLADGTAGIRIIDSTDPSNLTDIGVYHPSLADPIDICLSPSGNLAFISTFYGLEIVDIQDRSNLVQLGAFQTWNNCLDVEVTNDGNRAFVLTWQGLLVLDVSDPSTPQLVDSINTQGRSSEFELSPDENTVFIADNIGGIIVVDATNPVDLKWSRYIDPETTAKTEEVLLHPDGTTAFSLSHNEPAVRRINLYAEPQSFSSATIDIRMTNNAPPTIDPLQQYEIAEDSEQQVVSLTGISSGIGESQPIRVTATSSHPELIPNPIVTYVSPDATGSLAFTPVTNQHGTATITVTVDDGGPDNDLGTTEDNAEITAVFEVRVLPEHDAPTDISITQTSIDENAPVGTVVGSLSASDADLSDTFTFSLVDGGVPNDNSLFQINGTDLQTREVLNFETQDSYSVFVRATDNTGLWVQKAVNVTVRDVNDSPAGEIIIGSPDGNNASLIGITSNTLSDEDGLGALNYQWTRDGIAIPNAIDSSYQLTASDLDRVIALTTSYTDGGGFLETSTSKGIETALGASTTYTHSFDLRSTPDTLPFATVNAQVYREHFSPHVYYWAPASLNQWSEITYKFDLPIVIETINPTPEPRHL